MSQVTGVTHLLAELSSLDELQSLLIRSPRLKYTCLSVGKKYLALGSNSSGAYIFSRDTLKYLQVVFGDTETSQVVSVGLSPSDQYVAIALSSGQIVVFELNIDRRTKPERVRNTQDHAGHTVTALTWDNNSSKIFVGDNAGMISVIYVPLSKTKSLLTVPSEIVAYLECPVYQMECCKDKLLVSTHKQTHLFDTSKQNYSTIGTKPRDGEFGSCFFEEPSSKCVVIYCARPGSRMWEVDFDGKVLNTHQFKQLLSVAPIPVLKLWNQSFNFIEAPQSGQTVNFNKMFHISNFIVTWSSKGLYLFDPVNVKVLLWTQQFRGIQDMVVRNNDIYIFLDSGSVHRLTLLPVYQLFMVLSNRGLWSLSASLILAADLIGIRPAIIKRVKKDLLQNILAGLSSEGSTEVAEKVIAAIENIFEGSGESETGEHFMDSTEIKGLTHLPSGIVIVSEGVSGKWTSENRIPEKEETSMLELESLHGKLLAGDHRPDERSMVADLTEDSSGHGAPFHNQKQKEGHSLSSGASEVDSDYINFNTFNSVNLNSSVSHEDNSCTKPSQYKQVSETNSKGLDTNNVQMEPQLEVQTTESVKLGDYGVNNLGSNTLHRPLALLVNIMGPGLDDLQDLSCKQHVAAHTLEMAVKSTQLSLQKPNSGPGSSYVAQSLAEDFGELECSHCGIATSSRGSVTCVEEMDAMSTRHWAMSQENPASDKLYHRVDMDNNLDVAQPVRPSKKKKKQKPERNSSTVGHVTRLGKSWSNISQLEGDLLPELDQKMTGVSGTIDCLMRGEHQLDKQHLEKQHLFPASRSWSGHSLQTSVLLDENKEQASLVLDLSIQSQSSGQGYQLIPDILERPSARRSHNLEERKPVVIPPLISRLAAARGLVIQDESTFTSHQESSSIDTPASTQSDVFLMMGPSRTSLSALKDGFSLKLKTQTQALIKTFKEKNPLTKYPSSQTFAVLTSDHELEELTKNDINYQSSHGSHAEELSTDRNLTTSLVFSTALYLSALDAQNHIKSSSALLQPKFLSCILNKCASELVQTLVQFHIQNLDNRGKSLSSREVTSLGASEVELGDEDEEMHLHTRQHGATPSCVEKTVPPDEPTDSMPTEPVLNGMESCPRQMPALDNLASYWMRVVHCHDPFHLSSQQLDVIQKIATMCFTCGITGHILTQLHFVQCTDLLIFVRMLLPSVCQLSNVSHACCESHLNSLVSPFKNSLNFRPAHKTEATLTGSQFSSNPVTSEIFGGSSSKAQDQAKRNGSVWEPASKQYTTLTEGEPSWSKESSSNKYTCEPASCSSCQSLRRDISLALFIRFFFFILDYQLIKETLDNKKEEMFLTWTSLVLCSREKGQGDIVSSILSDKQIHSAMDYLRSCILPNQSAFIGHISRLIELAPAKTSEFCGEVWTLVSPLDLSRMLYLSARPASSDLLRYVRQVMINTATNARPDVFRKLCQHQQVRYQLLDILLSPASMDINSDSLVYQLKTVLPFDWLNILLSKIESQGEGDSIMQLSASHGYTSVCVNLLKKSEDWERLLKLIIDSDNISLLSEVGDAYIPKNEVEWKFLLKHFHQKWSSQTTNYDLPIEINKKVEELPEFQDNCHCPLETKQDSDASLALSSVDIGQLSSSTSDDLHHLAGSTDDIVKHLACSSNDRTEQLSAGSNNKHFHQLFFGSPTIHTEHSPAGLGTIIINQSTAGLTSSQMEQTSAGTANVYIEQSLSWEQDTKFPLTASTTISKEDISSLGNYESFVSNNNQEDSKSFHSITWNALGCLLVEHVGGILAISLLMECLSDLHLAQNYLTHKFFQICYIDFSIRAEQQRVTHEILEKLSVYMWKQKPDYLPPTVFHAIETEKQKTQEDRTFQGLFNQVLGLNLEDLMGEQLGSHWCQEIDVSRDCILCHLPLKSAISETTQGLAIFPCGHAFHKSCASGSTCPVLH